MGAPGSASMPQFTQLGNNALIVMEAIDPTTGAAVTGVKFTQVDIYADVEDAGGAGNQFNVGNPILLGLGA